MSSRAWLALAVASCGLTHARRAQADGDATSMARVHLRAGIADYDEGRYAEAANEMEQAFALRPVPDLQYDLAQCYERLGRLEQAVKAYEAYLGSSRNATDADVMKKRIENLRERMKSLAQGQEPSPSIAPPTETVKWRTIVVYREEPPPPGRVARSTAYGLFAVSAAGIATGVAFAVLTVQASNAVQTGGSVTNPPEWGSSSLRVRQDAAKLYPIGTGIGFAVGALAAGGGVGLFLAGRKLDREARKQRDREQASIKSIAPSFGAGSGGIALSGVF